MSNNTQIEGTLKVIGELQTFASGFTKRQIVVETPGEYPQTIPIEFVKDKIDLLQTFQVGQQVSVSIDIRGNEYNGKYYCNLNGWKIEHQGGQQQQQPPQNSYGSPQQLVNVQNQQPPVQQQQSAKFPPNEDVPF